jgi:hypothetical protein
LMNMTELKFIFDLLTEIDSTNLEEDKVLRAMSFVLNKISMIVSSVSDNAETLSEEDLVGVKAWR